MPRKRTEATLARQRFPEEFKREAVQMLLDGHSARSVTERLGQIGRASCRERVYVLV